jgi:uncharacterized membrane protein
MMTPATRERVSSGVLGVLLASSIGLHGLHVLEGSKRFWIGVTLLMTAFSLLSSTRLLGGRATAVFFGVGITLGFFFETLSVHTGFPFGPYYYTPLFGAGVLGVPFIIPLAWYVIVYLGYVVTNLMIENRPLAGGGVGQAIWLSLIGAGVVTAYDLAADPFMVQTIGAWVMLNPGDYFGEQLRGFVGWTLVSFLIAVVVRLSHQKVPARAPGRVTTLAAAYPLAAYGMWWLFFMLVAEPRGIRVVAAFAMGIPTLAAATGLWKWHYAGRSAETP